MKQQTAMEWAVEQICTSETPEKKAKDLINKFYIEGDMLKESHSYRLAKKCALIACDEVLNVWLEFSSDRIFWTEVKQEIEKL